tara:strand:+ start:1106 stop:2104 length:999 start_codon:yes stop_codon:yes gene_type:complete
MQLTSSKLTNHRYILAGLICAGAITAVIALTGARLSTFEIIGPTVPFQYPWRLVEPDFISQITAWSGYVLHNIYVWTILSLARKEKPGFSENFRWFNWAMLVGNGLFIGLHILQTHLYYDALARDVHEATAQGSVALMLMVILVIEGPRRGLFFGQLRFDRRLVEVLRKYHGYLFSWAIIYTFWYHPAVSTQGHLIGFFYMFMLLWQSVLVFNRSHRNRWWTLTLEAMVIPHAVLVAVTQPSNAWRMFGFGFATIFILTQMHGVGWNRATRITFGSIFVIALILAYAVFGDITQIHEVARIPVAEFFVAGVIYVLLVIIFKLRNRNQSTAPP